MRSAVTLFLAALMLAPMLSAQAKPGTKIGILDLQNQFHQYMKRLYETGNVPILKSEGWDRINYFKQHNPDGIVVYAMVGEDFDMEKEVPEEAARRRWESYIRPTLKKMSEDQKNKINYVEVSPNMKVPVTVEQGRWWSRYAEVLCPLVGEAGFRPMILTIGVGGIPCTSERELEILDAMIPALRAAHKQGGGWSYHGYSAYYTTDPQHEEYYSLRYRRAYRHFKTHAPDLMDMPIVLSEGGIDYYGDSRRDGYAYRGTREQYADWLAWYDNEIKKDPYVQGVTLFKAAGWGWEAFDLEPMAPYLKHYYLTGSMKLPRPDTKLGLALDAFSTADPSVRKALTAGGPVLYTSWKEVRPGGAVEVYKKANPDGKVIIDFRAPLPDEKAVPDAKEAARDRWDEIAAVIGKWSDAERALVDYLDATPGPVTIRHDKQVPSPRYYSDYLDVLTGIVTENRFKPVIASFNTSSVPSDGRDWDTLGGGFWHVWRARRDAGGIAIVHVDCTYPTMDRNSPASQFHFIYEGIYRSLLRLEPELFGVPIVVMAERLDLPRVMDWKDRDRLEKRKHWLGWYDSQLCADPDVMAVLMNPGIETTPTPGQKSVLDWYSGYVVKKGR